MRRSLQWTLGTALVTLTLVVPLAGVEVGGASSHEQPALLARAGTSSEVYVVATTGCGGPKCASLYRTAVDASHFNHVTMPPVMSESSAVTGTTLVKLIFANESDGYAEVGKAYPLKLYVTFDGARTWRQVALPSKSDLLNLDVTSNLVYATTAQCPVKNGNCTTYRVWRSSLTVHHWTELPALWTTGTGPKDTYYGPDVSAFGDTVWELETGFQKITLWTSHNEGRTFSRVNAPDLVSVAGCDLTPASSSDLWAECPTGMEVAFLDSHDGGEQWHHISQGVFSGTGGGDFDPISSRVAYLDYGLVSIRGMNLFRISEGGLHPTAVDNLKCTNVSLLFTSENDGLADCSKNYTADQLERTFDGGTAWQVVSLP